jgi:hypothetical protein
MKELLITINNVQKTEQQWLDEFEALTRPVFYKTYGILNKRLLWEVIENAKREAIKTK